MPMCLRRDDNRQEMSRETALHHEGVAAIGSSTSPGEDAHARMVVQRYLVAPWQAEDAQGECRLLMYVHVGHGGSPPTASA